MLERIDIYPEERRERARLAEGVLDEVPSADSRASDSHEGYVDPVCREMPPAYPGQTSGSAVVVVEGSDGSTGMWEMSNTEFGHQIERSGIPSLDNVAGGAVREQEPEVENSYWKRRQGSNSNDEFDDWDLNKSVDPIQPR